MPYNLEDLIDSSGTEVRVSNQVCPKCKGSGNFVTYTGKVHGKCFACNGTGKPASAKPQTFIASIAPAVDTAGIDRLKLAFDKARAFAAAKAPGLTLRNPKITIGGITISPAKAESKNPGALYVKEGSVYVGKIANGRFFAANPNGQDIAGKVQAFIADPAEAAKVYGQETGICCVCNATLKSKWRLRGIGPICAQKFGW
jgi:hypothetical protein